MRRLGGDPLEPRYRVGSRDRPAQQPDRQPLADLEQLEPVVDPAGVLECALRGLDRPGGPARQVVRLRDETPRPRQAELVAGRLEHRDRPFRGGDQIVGRDVRLCEQSEQAALDERMSGEPAVAGRRGRLDRLREHPVRPAEPRARTLDDTHVRDELEQPWIGRRQQLDGPRDEIEPGVGVAARERASAGDAQPLGGLPAERFGAMVEQTEQREIAVGLLEVVARRPPRPRSPGPQRSPRATARSARGGRRASPWGFRRRRSRGSAGGGSGRCAGRPQTARAGSGPCARATRAPAPPRRRAPRRPRSGRPFPPPTHARAATARRRSAARAALRAAPGSTAAPAPPTGRRPRSSCGRPPPAPPRRPASTASPRRTGGCPRPPRRSAP